MEKIKFAILAPGGIANCMARAVQSIDELECYAVASRNYERARNFADRWGFEKAYGSYEELVQDPQVELIYVASPTRTIIHMRDCAWNMGNMSW